MIKSAHETAIAARQSNLDEIGRLNEQAARVQSELDQIDNTISEINLSLSQALAEVPEIESFQGAYRRALAGFEIGQVTEGELKATSAALDEVKTKRGEIATKNAGATERCRETVAGLEDIRREHQATRDALRAALQKASHAYILADAACIGFDYVKHADGLDECYRKLMAIESLARQLTSEHGKNHVISHGAESFMVPVFKGPAFDGRALNFNQYLLKSARAYSYGPAPGLALVDLKKQLQALGVAV